MKTCSINGCGRKCLAKGLCGRHYQKKAKYGDPLASGWALTFESRFWSKVDKSGECWEWTATRNANGYGQVQVGTGVPRGAHRVSFELSHGPIPEGLDIDHVCHNPGCVNPAHLRAVTHKQNMENLHGPHRDSKVPYRGVYGTPSGRYQASAFSAGKAYYAGVHDTPEQAATAAAALRDRIFTCNQEVSV